MLTTQSLPVKEEAEEDDYSEYSYQEENKARKKKGKKAMKKAEIGSQLDEALGANENEGNFLADVQQES